MSYQTVKKLSRRDAGYLAGLIDGEGTITLSRRNNNKHRALVITISNTEMSILKYVQKITGVGKITNKRITNANHTPSFTYQVANRQALDILKQTANFFRSYKTIILDFTPTADATVDPPTIELKHAETPQPKIRITSFMDEINTYLVDVFEGVIFHICQNNVGRFAGFECAIMELPPERRIHKDTKFGYAVSLNGQWKPLG